MIRVVVVDDELACLAAMEEKLKLLEDVTVLKLCSNARDAIQAIETLKPDALFLDISMPHMDGFALLNELARIDFEIIFTTAHNEYAIRAIRLSAFDFLLKPVGMDELAECIERLTQKMKQERVQHQRQEQIALFFQHLQHPAIAEPRITLPTQDGLLFIPVKDIIRAESDSNYTYFYLSNGKKQLVSKTMKEFEDVLCSYYFFRVHKSHIVNLNFIRKYIKGDGGMLVLTDGTEVEVSRLRKADLLNKLQESH